MRHSKWTFRSSTALALLSLSGCAGAGDGEPLLEMHSQALFPFGGGAGSCSYVNPFSLQNECKQYSGSAWTLEAAQANCANVFAGRAGTFAADGTCSLSPTIGTCLVQGGTANESYTQLTGDASLCQTAQNACVGFSQGVFIVPSGGPCVSGGGGDGDPDAGALQSEAIAAMASTTLVSVTPSCNDAACVATMAGSSEFFVFAPRHESPRAGVIFYPGGNVDPRAYAPMAQLMAQEGVLVAIVPMPQGLAIFGVNRADQVRDAHPSISRWLIGGHSLGGVAATKYVATHQGAVQGLFLWASFPAPEDDLSAHALEVLSIYGTVDGLAQAEDVLGAAPQLPADTVFQPIVGGNHSWFAWHGLKEGDNPAELITQGQQSDLAAGATLHLVNRVLQAGPTVIDPLYAEAHARDVADGCARTQVEVANIDDDELPLARVENVHREAFLDFWSNDLSAPYLTPDEDRLVHVYGYLMQSPNSDDLDAPPVLDGELFCKMRTQESILTAAEEGEELTADCAQRQCWEQTARALKWAAKQLKHRLTKQQNKRVKSWLKSITYLDDLHYPSGPELLFNPDSVVDVLPGATPFALSICARSHFTGMDQSVYGAAYGRHYCKNLSYQSALALVSRLARTQQLAQNDGACAYFNPFSQANECKLYTGSGWNAQSAAGNCARVFTSPFPVSGQYASAPGESCGAAVGKCILDAGKPWASEIYFAQGTAAQLASACTQFLQGTFVAL